MDNTSISDHSFMDGAAAEAQKDDEYFLEDSFAVIKIEERLFQVPRYRLRTESASFASLFQKYESTQSTKGTTANDPFILLKTGSVDFKNILRLLYPTKSSGTEIQQKNAFTKDQWVGVLKTSTHLKFLKIRQIALTALAHDRPADSNVEELAPAYRVRLGRELSIVSWVLEGYTDLIKRDNTLSEKDVSRVGWKTAVDLFRLRERFSRGKLPDIKIGAELQKVFSEELKQIQQAEVAFNVADTMDE